MKYVLLLALVACQDKSHAPAAAGSAAPVGSAASMGSAAPVAPPVAPATICLDSLAAIEHSSCSNQQALQTARTSFEGILRTMTNVGGGDAHSYDIVCARMLLALERDMKAGSGSAGCALAIDPALRDRVQRTLDEYFNQRTPVTKTGDKATDDVIAAFAAMRDAACECRTSPCIDKLDAQAANLPLMPVNATQAAKDLASKMMDEAARCAQRARM